MTLYDIASTIRKYGGEVWLVQHGSFGIILRSSLIGRQFRVCVPRPGPAPPPFPEERNSVPFVPKDLPTLQEELIRFIQSSKRG